MGVQVLKECIARAGGLEAGLCFYVGAANLSDDVGYAGKVLHEQNALRVVASGRAVSPHSPPVPARVVSKPPVPLATELPNATTPVTPVAAPEQIAFLR